MSEENFLCLTQYVKRYLWFLLFFFLLAEARHTVVTKCEATSVSACRDTVNTTSLPNIFGHTTQDRIQETISPLLSSVSSNCPVFTYFVCSVFFPPCHGEADTQSQTVPCRVQCEAAYNECHDVLSGNDVLWPSELDCTSFPTAKCYMIDGRGKIQFVENSLHVQSAPSYHHSHPASLAPIESEVGDSDQYNVEVVSLSTSDIPQRRYDVIDLGDPDLFQGWADVQGTGAANDYCRVIGRGKRKFLSCALAGSVGQDHRYVSKLGFTPGHKNTWFMRDVDSDGRDDYCRCVGVPEESKIYCMKAGESGFYGSSIQGGSQYTFELPGSTGCYNRRLNPFYGA